MSREDDSTSWKNALPAGMTATPFESYGSVHVDEETIQQQLETKHMRFVDAEADGNCWFRVCSQALYGHENCHATIRQEVTLRTKLLLKSNPRLAESIPDGVGKTDFLRQLACVGTYIEGDLQCLASADVLGLDLRVWIFEELSAQLQTTIAHQFSPLANRSRRTLSNNWRKWDIFNHRNHEVQWTPNCNATVYVWYNETASWQKGVVQSAFRPNARNTTNVDEFVDELQFKVRLVERDAVVTVRKCHLHKRAGNTLYTSGVHYSSLVGEWVPPTEANMVQILSCVGVKSTIENCESLYNMLESARRLSFEAVLRFRLQYGGKQALSRNELQILLAQRNKSTAGNVQTLRKRVGFVCG